MKEVSLEKQQSRANGARRNGNGHANGSQGSKEVESRRVQSLTLADVSTELDDAASSLSRAAGMLRQLGGGDPIRSSAVTKPAPELGERLSVRQLSAIHSAARRVGLNQQKLAVLLEKVAGVPTEVACLTRKQASEVLDQLNHNSGSAS